MSSADEFFKANPKLFRPQPGWTEKDEFFEVLGRWAETLTPEERQEILEILSLSDDEDSPEM